MRAAFSFRVMITLLCLTTITCGCRRKSKKETEKSRIEEQMEEREKQLTFMKKNGEVDWRKRVEAASEALAQAKSDSRWGRKDAALKNALEAAKLMPPPSKDFDAPSRPPRNPPGGSAPDGKADQASSSGSKQSTNAGSVSGGNAGERSSGGNDSDKNASVSGGEAKGGASAEGSNVSASSGDGSDDLDSAMSRQRGAELNGSGSGAKHSGDTNSGDTRDEGSGDNGDEDADSGPKVTNAEVDELRSALEALLKALDGKAGKSKSGLSFERDAIEIR